MEAVGVGNLSAGLEATNLKFAESFCSRFLLSSRNQAADAQPADVQAVVIPEMWGGPHLATALKKAVESPSVVVVLVTNAAPRFDDLHVGAAGSSPEDNFGLHPYRAELMANGVLSNLAWANGKDSGCFPTLQCVLSDDSDEWFCARVTVGTGIAAAVRVDAKLAEIGDDSDLHEILVELARPIWQSSATQHLGLAAHNTILTGRGNRLAASLTDAHARSAGLVRNLEDAQQLNIAMSSVSLRAPTPVSAAPGEPSLCYVIIGYNMDRELDRTIRSALPPYQQSVEPGDVEVVVVDNGSPSAIEIDPLLLGRDDVRLLRLEPHEAGLAKALNLGAEQSRSPHVAMMIDGAHMLSPGVSRWALLALQTFREPVVALQRFFLGRVQQSDAGLVGYDQTAEDEMLNAIDWQNNGYRLFDHAVLVGDDTLRWEAPLFESNCLIMPTSVFHEIGGADERFTDPAGGFLNLDLFDKAVKRVGSDYVLLVGEASFHQFHGGTTMNAERAERAEKVAAYAEEYHRIFGVEYRPGSRPPVLLGPAGPVMLNARPFSADFALERQRTERRMLRESVALAEQQQEASPPTQ